MITFLISLVALVLGYVVYGRFVERVFAPDDRMTPAVGYAIGGGVGLATALCFMVWLRKMRAGARE